MKKVTIQNSKKVFAAVVAASAVFTTVAGCGSSDSTSASAANTVSEDTTEVADTETPKADEADTQSEEAEGSDEVKVYQIATEGAYAPYNYVGEDGQPDGYDIAVAKAVDELIPEVEFTYQAVEWSSIFAGLEAGRYDLIVSQTAKTPERQEKYLFTETPYAWDLGAIAYKAGRDDIKRLDDLEGKTLTVGVGSSNASFIEGWNEEHGNIVNVVYGDGDINKALLDVQEGRVDATLVSPVTAKLTVDEQGLDVEFALRDDEEAQPVYWLFANTEGNEELIPLVDDALKQLIESGKLREISKEYLGEDYSSKEAIDARIAK